MRSTDSITDDAIVLITGPITTGHHPSAGRREVLDGVTSGQGHCDPSRSRFASFSECPHCGGETRHRCPACDAPFPSAFAIECEECGAEIRPPEVLGVRIRKPGK